MKSISKIGSLHCLSKLDYFQKYSYKLGLFQRHWRRGQPVFRLLQNGTIFCFLTPRCEKIKFTNYAPELALYHPLGGGKVLSLVYN